MISKEEVKYYGGMDRGDWAELKLKTILPNLPNTIISDIGSGFGWFGPIIKKYGLQWQPFDYTRKIEETRIWDLNDPAPPNSKSPGCIIFLEVLEHLSNPELAIKNMAHHIEKGGYIILTTPNPLSAKSKFTLLFKNQLYAFQPKHLKEHHVFVPLPHVVIYYFEKYDFELIEYAVLGKIENPKFRIKFNFFKEILIFSFYTILGFFEKSSRGSTQAFFFRKNNIF